MKKYNTPKIEYLQMQPNEDILNSSGEVDKTLQGLTGGLSVGDGGQIGSSQW